MSHSESSIMGRIWPPPIDIFSCSPQTNNKWQFNIIEEQLEIVKSLPLFSLTCKYFTHLNYYSIIKSVYKFEDLRCIRRFRKERLSREGEETMCKCHWESFNYVSNPKFLPHREQQQQAEECQYFFQGCCK